MEELVLIAFFPVNSGADVQVSKRGIYAPGTTNRIVSVKGSQVVFEFKIEILQLVKFRQSEGGEKRDLPGAGEGARKARRTRTIRTILDLRRARVDLAL